MVRDESEGAVDEESEEMERNYGEEEYGEEGDRGGTVEGGGVKTGLGWVLRGVWGDYVVFGIEE